MCPRKPLVPAIVLVALLGIPATLAAQESAPPAVTPPAKKSMTPPAGKEAATVKAKIGEPAPGFTLQDASGKSYTLADYKGKIVVLQWINPDCPVCRRVASSGLVTAMHRQVREVDPDVVFLAINSTHYMEPDASAKYLKEHRVEMPALSDRDGTVGRLYGAKTTPHVYVIDAEGVLRYQGAFDDDPQGQKGDKAVNYVLTAIRQIEAGETVMPDTVKSYGCTVKYKPGEGEGGQRRRGEGRRRGGDDE
jgi:peroxiredoxin